MRDRAPARLRDGVLRRVGVVADRRHREELAVQVDEDRVVVLRRVRDHAVEEEAPRRGVVGVLARGDARLELGVLVRPAHRVVELVGDRVGDRVPDVVFGVPVRVHERLAGVADAVAVGVREGLADRAVVREDRREVAVEVHARLHRVGDVVAGRRRPRGHLARVGVGPRRRVRRDARLVRVRRVLLVAAVARGRDPVGAELEARVARLEVGQRRVDERLDRVHVDPPAGHALEREEVDVVDLGRRVGVAHRADDRGDLGHLLAGEHRVRDVAEQADRADAQVARGDAGEVADGDPPVPAPLPHVAEVAGQLGVGLDQRTRVERVGRDREGRVLREAVVEAVEVGRDLALAALDVRAQLGEDRHRLLPREDAVAGVVRALRCTRDVGDAGHPADGDHAAGDQQLDQRESARPHCAAEPETTDERRDQETPPRTRDGGTKRAPRAVAARGVAKRERTGAGAVRTGSYGGRLFPRATGRLPPGSVWPVCWMRIRSFSSGVPSGRRTTGTYAPVEKRYCPSRSSTWPMIPES